MPKGKTWADVAKGDLVKLRGKTYTVAKIKAKGKSAAVSVELGSKRHDAVVKLKDPVTIVKPPKLHDATGGQTRWAKPAELDKAVPNLPALTPGDAAAKKPPSKPTGGVWDRPVDRVEAMLADVLGARLVGESTDERKGWYVPPVDVSTVAAHLVAFHGIDDLDRIGDDEGELVKAHAGMHAQAEKGSLFLHVNHWHTAKRPGND